MLDRHCNFPSYKFRLSPGEDEQGDAAVYKRDAHGARYASYAHRVPRVLQQEQVQNGPAGADVEQDQR